jgi:hypothetical protein
MAPALLIDLLGCVLAMCVANITRTASHLPSSVIHRAVVEHRTPVILPLVVVNDLETSATRTRDARDGRARQSRIAAL